MATTTKARGTAKKKTQSKTRTAPVRRRPGKAAKAVKAKSRPAPKRAVKAKVHPVSKPAARKPEKLHEVEGPDAVESVQAAPASPADYPEKVRFILGVLDDMKAIDVDVYHVVAKTILTDFFIICTGSSSTHTGALADEVYLKCKGRGWPLGRMEGAGNPSWKILDYGDVVVHVFLEETREYYKLEEIWGEGRKTKGGPAAEASVLEKLVRSHPRAGSGATSALKKRRSAARASTGEA